MDGENDIIQVNQCLFWVMWLILGSYVVLDYSNYTGFVVKDFQGFR